MIGIVEIQSALIQWMKANSAIASLIPNTYDEDIRELNWQGDKFVYPNIRVHVSELTPDVSNCSKSKFVANIFIFSEQYSSLECDTIAGVILEQLHGKSFNVTLPSSTVVHIVGTVATQKGATTSDGGDKVWMGTVSLSASVN